MLATCEPVEVWAPIFVYYGETTAPKYNDKQIEEIERHGLQNGWCNIGDAPFSGSDPETHIQEHMKDLRDWRKKRARELEKSAAARLAAARAEKKLQKEIQQEEEDE